MATPFHRQPVIDAAGQTFAYVVPAEELHQLLAENERLKTAAETERREREERLDMLERVVADWNPTPATPEEMEEVARLGDNSHVLTEIVARMHRMAEGGDGIR